ncbi:MAG TPA: 6-phosphogluconolactonase [Nitrospiria bacterium]|nr:6-phosphogluconolactonase [Nitrospiria bacterium]
MDGSRREIVIAHDPADLHRRASEFVAQDIVERADVRGRVAVALSGGKTPLGLYERLAAGGFRKEIPWPRVHLFWGDERCVPPDHPASNYRAVLETLISRIAIPSENVHRMPAEQADPEKAADEYERRLRAFFLPKGGAWPAFDLVLLGIGSDGHTASLFPGSPALDETRRWVAAPYIEKLKEHRLTLTLPVLNEARRVVFLAAGEDKAEILRDLLGPDRAGTRLPVQRIKPRHGRLIFFLDRSAARFLAPEKSAPP